VTVPATPPRGSAATGEAAAPAPSWLESDAESLLRTLPGVISAKVVRHESGAIKEIHLLSTTEYAPKQVVRNVESAMLARFGARVDHRAVSVARSVENVTTAAPTPGAATPGASVASAAVAPAPPTIALPGPKSVPTMAAGRAIYFDDVEVRRSRSQGLSCTVTLRAAAERYVGHANGAESSRARGELAATATVIALRGLLAENVSLAFESCITVEATDRAFAFVVISGRAGRETTFLSGSCEVKDSLETAAVLAVLDATARWIERGAGH
jgi:hypothetical protein